MSPGALHFEWDPNKALANKKKHGVTFEEATTAFSDMYGRVMPDPDHSIEEDRFLLLAMSLNARCLTVVHCLRHGDTIRIISARKSTQREQDSYWRFRHER